MNPFSGRITLHHATREHQPPRLAAQPAVREITEVLVAPKPEQLSALTGKVLRSRRLKRRRKNKNTNSVVDPAPLLFWLFHAGPTRPSPAKPA
ncbi:MAG TPA: hypothetical protein VN801_04520, partial [Candidatus Udaeobacter sp.]|nr:hypothetical protein [Candidatus Udaeobacter sp.]